MKINLLDRRFVSIALAAFLFVAAPVAAQDPTPTTRPQEPTTTTQGTPGATTQPQQPQSVQPVVRPIAERTIGLDPGKVVRWTLRDAILAALDKNVDIELERENVRLQQYDLIAAQGFYDPAIVATTTYNKSATPNSFQFSGANAEAVTRDTITLNGGLRKSFERYGTTFSADFNNQRLGSNTNLLEVQYSPSFTTSITQPLFRNLRIDPNRRLIQLTKRRLNLSDAVFRQRVIEIVSTVQQAYWDLALAIRNEGIARESVRLAETQLNNNQRQVEVGTLAPIDVVSAATQVETRRQQVFQAMNAVAQAENQIKALTVSGPDDEMWTARIEPVESFDIKPVSIPVADAIRLAQANRPEVQQLGFQREINRIDIAFYRDQAKPQIDLIAAYTTNGLGGTAAASATVSNPSCSPTISDINDPTKLYCAPFAVSSASGTPTLVTRPLVPVTFTSQTRIADQFIGGYFTSLGNLFRNEFRTISVGLQINIPLRNRTAKANLGRAIETERQTDIQTRRLLQNIEVEVRNAVQQTETAKLRIEAARAAREYAQQQLAGEEKRFAAGLTTTFFILQRQNDLSQAQYTELQALADYNKSVATLQRAISTTLSSNSLEIKPDTPVTIK